MTDTIEIKLGHGNHIITDIFDSNGEWSGIAISYKKCDVGEFIDTGAKTVGELNPSCVIISDNSRSLEVVIQALLRARSKLKSKSNDIKPEK